MRKAKLSRTQSLLLVTGLLMNTATQIITHYYTLPDFVSGLLSGAGIGVMLLSLLRSNNNSGIVTAGKEWKM